MTRGVEGVGTWQCRAAARWWWLAPLLVGAAVLAINLSRASLWADEVATWSAASRSWPALARLLRHQDVVLGLYYALMHVWIAVVGSSSAALRALSAVACLGTIAVVTRFAGRRWSPLAGVFAGVWLVGNPFFMLYGITGRPYALVALVAAWTTTVVLDSPRRHGRIGYAAASVLGVLLHLYYGLFVVAQIVAVVATDRRRVRNLYPGWVASAGAATSLAVMALGQRGQIDWIRRTQPAQYWTWWPHLAGHADVTAVAFAVLAIAAVSWRRLSPADRVLLGACAALPSLILLSVSWWVPTYDARYVIESVPSLALLVAAGAARVVAATRAAPSTSVRRVAAAAAGGSVVALAGNAAAMWTRERSRFFHENLSLAAAQVRAAAHTHTAVIFLPGEARGALYYYLDGDQDGDLPAVDLTAQVGTDPVDAANFSGLQRPLAQVTTSLERQRRVVVVTLGAPPETASLKALERALQGFSVRSTKSEGEISVSYLARSG